MNFDPEMNQPQNRVKMLRELHTWAEYMPDWAWKAFAWIRPIIRRGGAMKKDEEERLWSIWKTTNYWKNVKKQVPPPDEDRPNKQKKTKNWVD